MIRTERQKESAELVERHGLVKTLELSESLRIALSTVRRDLEMLEAERLEAERLLRRGHRGAVSVCGRECDYSSP